MLFKKYILGLVIFLSLLSVKSAFSATPDWQSLEPGFDYRIFSTPQGKPIHVFRVNPKLFEIKPLFKNNERFYIKNSVEESGALLGINANFFDEKGKALGVVVIDGETKNPFKDISWWGVLTLSSEGKSIETPTPYLSSSKEKHYLFSNPKGSFKNLKHAIQAGPRLVTKGVVQKLKPESSPKTAIGINEKKDFFFVVSQSSFSIQDLAEFMAKKESEGGLGCQDALNLDGGPSTQVYAKIASFELSLPTFSPVPVGLGVFHKAIP